MVLLKLAPMKGVLRFGRKVKVCPHFIVPFEIVDRIRVANRLALPSSLSMVHNVFHVSIVNN